MPRGRAVPLLLGLVILGGCASKGDLRRLEEQMMLSRAEQQRSDSARAAQLSEVIAVQRRIRDSLDVVNREVGAVSRLVQTFRGDLANDLVSVQQQLVQIQALTGQSQQRLTELQTQVEARSEQINNPGAAPDSVPSPAGAPAGSPPAEQIYSASLQQLRRGSTGTARLGFRELLRLYPTHPRASDATYFVGETFAAESPDSAAFYYDRVVRTFSASPRAASALYKLGLLAERRKDMEGAREYFQRVVRDYPRSDEAALARDRLKSLGR